MPVERGGGGSIALRTGGSDGLRTGERGGEEERGGEC